MAPSNAWQTDLRDQQGSESDLHWKEMHPNPVSALKTYAPIKTPPQENAETSFTE